MSSSANLLHCLPGKCRRGSKPRCHLLTHGSPTQVATRLTGIIGPWGSVTTADKWMPDGFDDIAEAQLHDATRLLPKTVCNNLQNWWMAVRATTPNWDIASTCTIEGKKGLLLVEAKAHDEELMGEVAGKSINANASCGSLKNHAQIDNAIQQANNALNAVVPGWNLSRNSHYQMSNRFAWAWKLTDLGIPVILVYLGFKYAVEMSDVGNPFIDHLDWEKLVLTHSKPLFPAHVWDRKWIVRGQAFIPLIRSI